MSETAVMTTSDVADELGTDPKTLRKFFRSEQCEIEPVGQGKRYAITADDIDDLKTAFDLWTKGKAAKATKKDEKPITEVHTEKELKKAKKGKKSKKKVVEDEPSDEVLEALEDDPDLDLDDLEMD